MKTRFHQSYFFMAKTRRERCPHCGFLDVIDSYGLNGGFLESKQ